ncbi:hypothetical protein ACQ4LE_006278 [Meloidogyne hapla]
MLTDLENYLIELTKPSIENTDLEEQKVKGMLKRHEIDKLENLIFTILESKQLKQEFFKTTFRPALGHLLSLLLDTFGCSKMDIEIRRKCAFLICEITHIKHKELSTNFIAFVLPGIFIRIKRVIIQQIHSIEIVQFSSKILSNILIIAFSPLFKQNFIENKLISAPSIITFERNIEWINMAKEKIFPQFCLILTNLASSKIDSIRFEAVRLISVIFADKGEFCGDDFNKISIDICFLLFNDEQIRISDECQHLFTKLQSENANLVETYLINKLIASLKSLEKDVINAANGQIPLQNFFNILQMLGSGSLNRLCFSSDFKELLLNSILSIIVVDKQKQLISCVKNFEKEKEGILPPLKFGIDSKIIFNIAQLLVILPNFEDLFDILISKFISTKTTNLNNIKLKTSILYLIYSLISTISTNNFDKNKISNFVNDIICILKLFDSLLEEEILDSEIVGNLPLNTEESCLVGLTFNCLSSINLDIIDSKDRGDLLYETLKYCSSSNICVREAADNCLNKLVENSTQYEDVSEAIFENAHLLMFKILMAAQDFQANPRFPMVLSEMILRCSNPKIYFKLRGALDELLFWLDFSNQQQTLLLLFSLKNYCKALFNWFYPLIPQIIDEQQPSTSYKANEEDSDDEEINKKLLEEGNNQNDLNYPLIQNSVTILKRTKHFISSQYLPVQLNILDILKYSLELVKNYENELLPMIHQNWHGLIQKFGNEVEENAKFQNVQLSDSEMLVAIKSVDVIKTISSISKDFVYWKIVKEYLPRICALLEGLYKQTIKTTKIVVVKESVIKHSVAFKLQLALVESIPSIIENSDAFKNNNNLQRLKEILLLYSNLEDKNLEVLTNTARESLKRLEELEEEKRREN